MKLKKGNKAPDFALPNEKGKLISLSSFKDKWVLLYFYPKDDTPGCTKEACAIRDDYSKFKRVGAKVLGVSVDSPKSHSKFKDKYDLPFALLSDENKEVVKLYGVWKKKKFMGKEFMGTERVSFLINPKGKISKIYEKVVPEIHALEVIEDLKKLKK
jgi:thioredoxin-dependent peroxiredoxin